MGLTFALVSNSLQTSPSRNVPKAANHSLLAQCKEKAQPPQGTGKGLPKRVPISPACKQAFEAGATAASTNQRDYTMHELEVYSWLGLAVLTILSAGLGWVMAGRALRPVHEITEAARRASEHQLGERLHLSGPDDELKQLADTFDAMLDRLDLAFAAQRQFVSNASHELRTPLTAMRTSIDVTLAKPTRTPEQLEAMAEKVRRSIDRAEHIIDALLMLAASNRGIDATEPLDLATAAEDALDAVRDVAQGARIRFDAELEPAEVMGSRVLLERMVGNIVDNAVVHNVPDGWVRVRSGSRDGHAYVEVANSGPVVPVELVPQLFEPFHRADPRTGLGGVGLGLSIVRSVGDAHDARVDVRPRVDGGLEVTITMPLCGASFVATG